jgi:hypothetical protein
MPSPEAAVLAKGGDWVPMTDLFGIEGNLLLDRVTMPAGGGC